MMIRMKLTTLLGLTWMFISHGLAAQPNDENRFFGQEPPGSTPEEFAPGIISLTGHTAASITFSPDMNELFFARRKQGESHNIYTAKRINGRWSAPELAPFSKNKEYLDFHVRFSPQGDRLYFGSNRPIGDTTDVRVMAKWQNMRNLERLHLWSVQRTERGWGQPTPILEEPLKDRFIMCATPSQYGNLYFTSKEKGEKLEDEGIYYATSQNGTFQKPMRLGATINGNGKWIAHPFIAPDESYLLYDAERSRGEENGDLYVSFHKEGVWSESFSLGPEINTELSQGTATVSPDGKHLFFSSVEKEGEMSGLFWVSTAVIERLRPDDFRQAEGTYEIAYASKTSRDGEIYLTDRAGKRSIMITDREGNDGYAAWSPDGKRIACYAYHDGRKTWSIHTMNTDGSNRKRLTHSKNKWDSAPAWSPDGKKIAFGRAYRDMEGDWQHEVWIMNADGSDQKQLKPLDGGAPSFTPEGKIVYHSTPNASEIFIADQDGSNKRQLTSNEAEEWHPEVSPDGKEIVFMSDRDGNHEIYVMNIDGSNPRRLTNNEVRDSTPTWSPDGSQILFTSSEPDGEERNLYLMNRDGTELRMLIENAGAPAWLK